MLRSMQLTRGLADGGLCSGGGTDSVDTLVPAVHLPDPPWGTGSSPTADWHHVCIPGWPSSACDPARLTRCCGTTHHVSVKSWGLWKRKNFLTSKREMPSQHLREALKCTLGQLTTCDL
eukprot:jgi/Botrbrau1/4271/Bobra.0390s0011.1